MRGIGTASQIAAAGEAGAFTLAAAAFGGVEDWDDFGDEADCMTIEGEVVASMYVVGSAFPIGQSKSAECSVAEAAACACAMPGGRQDGWRGGDAARRVGA